MCIKSFSGAASFLYGSYPLSWHSEYLRLVTKDVGHISFYQSVCLFLTQRWFEYGNCQNHLNLNLYVLKSNVFHYVYVFLLLFIDFKTCGTFSIRCILRKKGKNCPVFRWHNKTSYFRPQFFLETQRPPLSIHFLLLISFPKIYNSWGISLKTIDAARAYQF